jgi:sulfur-oxidizing protein SoxZ
LKTIELNENATFMATTARTLITIPTAIKRGEVAEIRVLIQHPMETGYRRSSEGVLLKRDLIRRLVCMFEAQSQNAPKPSPMLVFQASFHAATAANPYLAFPLRAKENGTLVFTWEGDNGFSQTERRALVVS